MAKKTNARRSRFKAAQQAERATKVAAAQRASITQQLDALRAQGHKVRLNGAS